MDQKQPPKKKSSYRGINSPAHPRHPSVELKLEVLHRCFELGEDVKSVSDEIGYSRASIYTWRRKYLQKETIALMNPADDPRGDLASGVPASSEEMSQLKTKIQDLQMQVDILKETISVLKKDPGADRTVLQSREKAAIIDALKNQYPLPNLLEALHYARSSYYYHKKIEKRHDKYAAQKEQIRAIFEENHLCCGYRRIYLAMKKGGVQLSEKVIRRLMKQEQLQPIVRKKRAYSSYQGETTPAAPNMLQRNFPQREVAHRYYRIYYSCWESLSPPSD